MKDWTEQDELEFRQWASQRGVKLGGIEDALFDYRQQFLNERDFQPPTTGRQYPQWLQDMFGVIGYDPKERKLMLLKHGNAELNLRRGSPFGLFFDQRF